MFALTDNPVRQFTRRGNWKSSIGYRTWISVEIGTISRVAEGLAVADPTGETLISASEDWSAEHVVAAMMETLSASGLDEVSTAESVGSAPRDVRPPHQRTSGHQPHPKLTLPARDRAASCAAPKSQA